MGIGHTSLPRGGQKRGSIEVCTGGGGGGGGK